MNKRKHCEARLILGSFLSVTWQQTCKIRYSGTCCKDCSDLKDCKNPCSNLFPYYRAGSDSYDLTNFKCPYYLTKVEAVMKKVTGG